MPGPRSAFKKMPSNPNGQNGCLCSPHAKVQDCVGPYIVGTHAEMNSVRNPYLVIGCGCAKRMAIKLEVAKTVEAEKHVPKAPAPLTVDEAAQALADAWAREKAAE